MMLISTRPENMLAALRMLRSQYGSAEKYVLDHCGLSTAQVAQIRDNLVVDLKEAEGGSSIGTLNA